MPPRAFGARTITSRLGAWRAVGNMIATLHLDSKGFNNGIAQAAGRLGMLKGVGVAASLAIGGSLVQGLKEAAQARFEFQHAMEEVFTLLPDLSKQAMDTMSSQVEQFARDSAITLRDAAEGAYQSVSAGVGSEDLVDFLSTANDLAVAWRTDVPSAVNATTTVINAYGKEMSEAASVTDDLFTIIQKGVTRGEQLYRSLGKIVPTAASLNIEFEEIGAAMTVLTRQGNSASEAATRVVQAMVQLSRGGGKAANIFRDLTGKSFPEFTAEGGTLIEALQVMRQHIEDTGKTVYDVFGRVEGANAVASLTSGPGLKMFEEAMNTMANNTGVVEEAAENLRGSLAFQFQEIHSTLGDVVDNLTPMLEMFAGVLVTVAKPLTTIVEKLTVIPREVLDPTSGFWQNWGGPLLLQTGREPGEEIKDETDFFAPLLSRTGMGPDPRFRQASNWASPGFGSGGRLGGRDWTQIRWSQIGIDNTWSASLALEKTLDEMTQAEQYVYIQERNIEAAAARIERVLNDPVMRARFNYHNRYNQTLLEQLGLLGGYMDTTTASLTGAQTAFYQSADAADWFAQRASNLKGELVELNAWAHVIEVAYGKTGSFDLAYERSRLLAGLGLSPELKAHLESIADADTGGSGGSGGSTTPPPASTADPRGDEIDRIARLWVSEGGGNIYSDRGQDWLRYALHLSPELTTSTADMKEVSWKVKRANTEATQLGWLGKKHPAYETGEILEEEPEDPTKRNALIALADLWMSQGGGNIYSSGERGAEWLRYALAKDPNLSGADTRLAQRYLFQAYKGQDELDRLERKHPSYTPTVGEEIEDTAAMDAYLRITEDYAQFWLRAREDNPLVRAADIFGADSPLMDAAEAAGTTMGDALTLIETTGMQLYNTSEAIYNRNVEAEQRLQVFHDLQQTGFDSYGNRVIGYGRQLGLGLEDIGAFHGKYANILFGDTPGIGKMFGARRNTLVADAVSEAMWLEDLHAQIREEFGVGDDDGDTTIQRRIGRFRGMGVGSGVLRLVDAMGSSVSSFRSTACDTTRAINELTDATRQQTETIEDGNSRLEDAIHSPSGFPQAPARTYVNTHPNFVRKAANA